jgi:hypothetical protein
MPTHKASFKISEPVFTLQTNKIYAKLEKPTCRQAGMRATVNKFAMESFQALFFSRFFVSFFIDWKKDKPVRLEDEVNKKI